MINHVRKHFNIIEGICDICYISVKWKSDLKKHIKNFHSTSPIKIEILMLENYEVIVAYNPEDSKTLPISMLWN